jgi:acetyl-CoA acetyltransferase family protein
MREAVIVASSRTPLAKSHRGSFNMTRPDDLAAHTIRHVLGKAPQLDSAEIEEVILGCGQPHGPQGHNIARVATLRAGLPVATAGVTVNRLCNSGLQAIVQAAHMIVAEGVEAAIGGGVESISMVARDNSPNGWVKEHYPGLYMVMGETAEVVARRHRVSREQQDEYALLSQQRTARAQAAGWLADELAPITVTRAIVHRKTQDRLGEETATVSMDECNRPDTTLDTLRALPPVFDTTSGQGSVTNGGSIAIGHPFGMTGSRLVGTIANEMVRRKARYGVVTMCVGGGQGAAALFERA